MRDRSRLPAWWIVAASMALPGAVRASVQDYQILRLLSYHSECRVAALESRPPVDGALRYSARCENDSTYQNGVEIECADRDDEQSCRILTQPKSFDQLHLLDQPAR